MMPKIIQKRHNCLVFNEQFPNIYKEYILYLFWSTMKCPVCGGEASATGKEWKFGQFDAKGYKCGSCAKSFSGYYKAGKLSHTVPKAK